MRKSLFQFLLFSVSQTFCPVEIEHDVFISFRGKDVRNGFRNDLIKELRDKEIGGREIDVFVDDRLERGNDILPTIFKKIERSQILLVIFSPRFATSTWCLEELCKMIKCCNRNSGTQILIPIFYYVSPSEVRHQSGDYEFALSIHKQNEEDKCKVKIWRSALENAAKLTGFCYPSDMFESEAKFIEGIVEYVSAKVNQDAKNAKSQIRKRVLCTFLFVFISIFIVFLVYVFVFILF